MKSIETLKFELKNLTSQKENLEKEIVCIEKELSVDYSQYLNKWFKLYGSIDEGIHYFKPTEIHYDVKYDWFDFVGPSIIITKNDFCMNSKYAAPVEKDNIASTFKFELDFNPLSEAKERFDKLCNTL
jgi:hypothetical protein